MGRLGAAKIALVKVIPGMQRGGWSDVIAISSRDAEKAKKAADRLGVQRAYSSYEDLLADPEIEAIYNPLPNHLHVPWSIRAAEAGKHVLCEKPIGLSSPECRELIAVRDRTGAKISEAFMVRTHPAVASRPRIDPHGSDWRRCGRSCRHSVTSIAILKHTESRGVGRWRTHGHRVLPSADLADFCSGRTVARDRALSSVIPICMSTGLCPEHSTSARPVSVYVQHADDPIPTCRRSSALPDESKSKSRSTRLPINLHVSLSMREPVFALRSSAFATNTRCKVTCSPGQFEGRERCLLHSKIPWPIWL